MASLIRFERKVRRAGGTLAITIPPEIQKALNIEEGQDVELFVNDSKNIEIEISAKVKCKK